jgi:thiol-disulfide isomerase/thioredoxin
LLGMFVLAGFALAACSSSQAANEVMSDMAGNSSNAMPDAMANEMSDEMSNSMPGEKTDSMSGEMADSANTSDQMMGSSHESMAESQMGETQESADTMMDESSAQTTWLDYQFTDATSGEPFSISGFKGKVVLVETMAMWCSNCMKQQIQVKELHSLLGERDDFIGIGIDVDPNEDLVRLANYVEKNGFHWLYGVAPAEVLAGIQDSLGGQFLNPPSTPIVLFDKDGLAHPLPFGLKSASDLLSFVEQYLN